MFKIINTNMIRSLISATTKIPHLSPTKTSLMQNGNKSSLVSSAFQRYFSVWQPQIGTPLFQHSGSLVASITPVRTVTKYSIRKGKRKSVKTVLKRFYRLHWGGWIRRIAGSHKKLWKKSAPQKRRLLQHVLCNSTQSYMLDKMVGSYWRRPRFYVNDPYQPYHSREEFYFTARKPRPYNPPEEKL